MKGFAIVPYIQGNSELITRILNNCDTKVALEGKFFLRSQKVP